MKYKDGTQAKSGDVIQWHCDDRDDCTTWTMTGIYHSNDKIVYLGGGVDFGMAIGKIITVKEVEEESENNDSYQQGIQKIGNAFDVVKIIKQLPLQ
jgi:hypothetical protein